MAEPSMPPPGPSMTARTAAITGNGFAETACQVAVQNTYNTTGTVTRSRIAVLSPTAIKALFYGTAGADTYAGWHEMKSLLKHQIEMQACGIRRDSLYDWMMSSNRPGMGRLINVQHVSRGPSLISPFITGRQQSFWNVDHWVTLSEHRGLRVLRPRRRRRLERRPWLAVGPREREPRGDRGVELRRDDGPASGLLPAPEARPHHEPRRRRGVPDHPVQDHPGRPEHRHHARCRARPGPAADQRRGRARL
jgi:hypothetical protein